MPRAPPLLHQDAPECHEAHPETKGLVERSPGPDDRRSVRVQLTRRAHELIDEFFAEHIANEARLFAGLTADEREQLASLLRTALHALGDTDIT